MIFKVGQTWKLRDGTVAKLAPYEFAGSSVDNKHWLQIDDCIYDPTDTKFGHLADGEGSESKKDLMERIS